MSRIAVISIIIAVFAPLLPGDDSVDLTEKMKDSLVFLEVSRTSWEQLQPWRQTAVSTAGVYGTAVGSNEVLTIAGPLANATSIRARRYDQNEYISARIKAIDYEYNLCLLELDEAAIRTPLEPLQFSDKYSRGKDLYSYRLDSSGSITKGRAGLDRAEVQFSPVSFVRTLYYILTTPSRPADGGEVFCLDGAPVGIACWGSDAEIGLIPAEMIQRFFEHGRKPPYRPFGAVGFEISSLLDPAVRKFLKMPEDCRNGVYVSSVYTMGTGSSELVAGDVILSIDSCPLNPYGRYQDPRYERIGFEHLIAQHPAGTIIPFEIFRNGKKESVDVKIQDIKADQMLIPYYLYDKRPEYLVVGGFVFQTLTRDYMTLWGENWQGRVPPHLFWYFRENAFCPTDQRQDVVLLSYVLPTESNLGYHQLGQLVVKSFNGIEISSLSQMADVMKKTAESPFYAVEFELQSPTVVIPKAYLPMTNQMVKDLYGIPEISYIDKK
jgi:S1-C subfamily serine protease